MTKSGGIEVKKSKMVSFRLPLPLALEVEREVQEGSFQGCNTPSGYLKRLVELRRELELERNRQLDAAFNRLKELEPTPREAEARGWRKVV